MPLNTCSILSLRNSTRKMHAINQATKLGLQYNFFEPIPPSDTKIHFDVSTAQNIYGRELKPEEISCSISHFSITKDTDSQIIFEDDFKTSCNVPFDNLIKYLDKISTPTVLILGYSKHRVADNWLMKAKHPMFNKTRVANVTFGRRPSLNFCGAVAYITNKSYKNLSKEIRVVYWLADDWHTIQKENGVEILHLYEPIFFENLDDKYVSSLDNKIHFRHSFYNSPIKQILKVIRAQLLRIISK